MLFDKIPQLKCDKLNKPKKNNENESAKVEQMSEKSIAVLFYYFSCVIHFNVKI